MLSISKLLFAAGIAVALFMIGCEECDTGKIAFEREELARFDAVEFCIPRDEAKDQALLSVSPDLKLMPGSRGRIGCDQKSQTLCLLEIRKEPVGNLEIPKRLWEEICGLSRLAFVGEIRGTWLE